MSIKLLPAANPVESLAAAEVSSSLTPVSPRAISTQASQAGRVPSSDVVTWSSSARTGQTNWIDATPVEDWQSDATGAECEYVSGWAGSRSAESTAISQYLYYAAAPSGWSGRLINVYA